MFKKILSLKMSLFCILNLSTFCVSAVDIAPAPATLPVNANSSQGQAVSKASIKLIDQIEIVNPWARASLSPNNNSATYLSIKNTSDNQLTLIGAGAMKIANNVELHQSYVDEKGVSKMTAIDKIIIPANSEITLKPAGMHIMLLDLKRALKAGDKFKLDLRFQNIGTKTVDVEVIPILNETIQKF